MDVVELVTTQPVDALNLNENQLTSLPEEIGLMTGLKELYLSEEPADVAPGGDWIDDGIEELYLSENQLTSLPEEIGLMTGLKELYLNENQLTSLPEEIGLMTGLKTLYLMRTS